MSKTNQIVVLLIGGAVYFLGWLILRQSWQPLQTELGGLLSFSPLLFGFVALIAITEGEEGTT
jgi:hypothetical protein